VKQEVKENFLRHNFFFDPSTSVAMNTRSSPQKAARAAADATVSQTKQRDAVKDEIECNKVNVLEVKDVPFTSDRFTVASDESSTVEVTAHDFFLSFLNNDDIKKCTLLFPLDKAINPTYPKDTLIEFSKRQYEVVQGGVPHIPKFYFFAVHQLSFFDPRLKYSLQPFKLKLESFYNSIFGNKVDHDSIKKMLNNNSKSRTVIHIMILELTDVRLFKSEIKACKDAGSFCVPCVPSDFQIIAASSFSVGKK
jgi:hypothetical protein